MSHPHFSVLDTTPTEAPNAARGQYRVLVLHSSCHDHINQPYTQYWVVTDPSITTIKDERILLQLKDVLSPRIHYSVTTINRMQRAQFYQSWDVIWIQSQTGQEGDVNVTECQGSMGTFDMTRVLLPRRVECVMPPRPGVYQCENRKLWYYQNSWYQIMPDDTLVPNRPGCMVYAFNCRYGNWLQKAQYLRQWLM